MKDWVLSDNGVQWSVKFDVRDLGGHLDTTFRWWSSTLAARVRLAISRLVLIFILPLDFHGRVRIVRSMYLPAALHGIESSLLASDSLRKLRSSFCRVVWSRCQPMASVGAVLSFLDGRTGCDPAFCVVWFRFRLFRRYLSLWPAEVGRVYRLLEMVSHGCPGHGPVHPATTSCCPSRTFHQRLRTCCQRCTNRQGIGTSGPPNTKDDDTLSILLGVPLSILPCVPVALWMRI